MSMRQSLSVAVLWSLVMVVVALPAVRAAQPAAEGGAETAAAASPAAQAKEFVTEHSLKIGEETLRYKAVASETYILNEAGEPEASVFSIGYFLQGAGEASTRPITFLFNGGPGSTAVWLHLGAFGPRRLALEDATNPGAPPYELVANAHTLLPATDMVFVDPIGTGYSHALGEGEDSGYWGVDEDADSMARFITTYLKHHGRWASPKYLAGESYGTIRASLLVRELQLDLLNNVALNGVILLSSALDTRIALSGVPGNEMGYVATLPTFTAAAYYHDRLPARPDSLEAALDEAREYAGNGYLTALFAGDSLPADRRQEVAADLHRLTGLSAEYWLRSRLRVPIYRFAKELLRDRGEVIALHDARFLGQDVDEAGEAPSWDPFITPIAGPFITAINTYLADELETDFEGDYQVFSLAAATTWKPGREQQGADGGFLYTTPYLAQAAAGNADFRIFVASGYHDMVTPFFGIEHIFDHSGIDKERITLRNYFGGHMMYLHEPSLEKLGADIRAFIEGG